MKILIYKAKPIEFNRLYQSINTIDGRKKIFSNKKDFDKSQINIVLPLNIEGSEESIFLVPEAWKDDFDKLLTEKEKEFGDKDKFDINWLKEQTPKKPSRNEIGFINENELSQFYEEEVEILESWTLKKSKVWSLKVIIYTAEIEVPFDEFYEPLGSWKKIIFSNKIPFDEKTVSSLLDVIDFEDDSTVFYVPLEMKEIFLELLKVIKKWNIEITPLESLKEPMGIIWDKFSQFYEKMNISEALKIKIIPEKNECPNKELESFLNKIVQKDDSIDAVFVFDFKNSKFCKSVRRTDIEKFSISKIDSVTKCFDPLIEFHIASSNNKKTGIGKLEGEIIHFANGIIYLYFISEKQHVIGFISKTYGVGELLWYGNKHVDIIKRYL